MTGLNANRLPDQERDGADSAAGAASAPSERQAGAAGRDGTQFRLPPTFPAAPDSDRVSERQAAAKAQGIARDWGDEHAQGDAPEPDARAGSPHDMKPEEIMDRILERIQSPAAERNLGMSFEQAREQFRVDRVEIDRLRGQGAAMQREIRQLHGEYRQALGQARELARQGDNEGAWQAYQRATRANLGAADLEVKAAHLRQERSRMSYKAQALLFQTYGVQADPTL